MVYPQLHPICDQDVAGVFAFWQKYPFSKICCCTKSKQSKLTKDDFNSETLMLIPTNILTQMSLSLNSLRNAHSKTDCHLELAWESITSHQNQVHPRRTLMLTFPGGTDPSIPSWLGPGFEACPQKSLPDLNL